MVPIKNEGVCAQSRKLKNEAEMYNCGIQDNSLPLVLRDSEQDGKTRRKENLRSWKENHPIRTMKPKGSSLRPY